MDSPARSDYKRHLVHLFSSPICWNAHRLCTFFNDPFKNIQDIYRKRKRGRSPPPLIRDEETMKFRTALDTKAIELELWPTDKGKTWKDELEKTRFFEFLKETTKHMKWFNVEHYDGKSFFSLIQLIRDSLAHPQVGKYDAINWYREEEDGSGVTLVFDKSLFVQFWITRFPKLPLFIWNEFKSRSNELKDFYQGSVDFSKMKNFHTPIEFAVCVAEACKEQMKAGRLEGRYKMSTEKGIQTVELRPLHIDILTTVLNGSTVARINLRKEQLIFSWSNNDEPSQKLSYSFSSNEEHETKAEPAYYVFTNEFGDEDYCVLDRWILKAKKVIVFMPPNSIKEAINYCHTNDKFTAYPVKWEETAETVMQNLQISVQGRKFPLNSLIKENVKFEKILCKLEGEELNSLLKRKEVELLDEYKHPKISDVYFRRRIRNRAVVSSEFFSVSVLNNAFIIINCSLEDREKMARFAQPISRENVFPALKLGDTWIRIFVVEDEIENFDSNFSSFEGCNSNKLSSVHFFRSIGNNRFEWLKSHGNSSNIEQYIKSAADTSVDMLFEKQFRKSLNTEQYKNERLIFIAGEPGMGKSEFSKSLAVKLKKEQKNKTVLKFAMSEFMMNLKEKVGSKEIHAVDENILKGKVVESLSELTCKNEVKNEIFAYLLGKGLINFELILDALDEVEGLQSPVAFTVIKALQENISSVRIWVTLREHLLGTVRKEFGKLGYALEPFDKDEQVEFLVWVWLQRMENVEITKAVENQLEEFAHECIEKCLSMDNREIAGIPLQCRIIGEVFEGHVLEGNFSIEDRKYQVHELYELFFEKKLEWYLRERKRLNIDMDDATVLSLRKLISDANTALSLKLLFPRYITHPENADASLSIDLVLGFGIVTNIEPPIFLHRTFAEYLAARFVVEKLELHFEKHKNFENIDEKLNTLFFNEMLRCGIRGMLGKKTNCYSLYSPNITLLKFIDMRLTNVISKIKVYQNDVHQICDKFVELACSPDFDTMPKWNRALITLYDAINLKLENLMKLMISFPGGRLRVLLFGILHPSEDISDIVSKFDLAPDDLRKMNFLDTHENGVLHHLIKACLSENCSREKFEKMLTYVRNIVRKDPTLLEQKNANGQTPFLYHAHILKNWRNMADFDEDYGLEIDIEETHYWKVFLLLEELGADTNAVDKWENTYLHCLMSGGNSKPSFDRIMCQTEIQIEYLKLLKKHGYSKLEDQLNSFNEFRVTPLLNILWNSFRPESDNEENLYYGRLCEIINVFVECGANINKLDRNGDSILHRAMRIRKGYLVVISLIDNGADVCATDEAHMAWNGNREVCKFLRNRYPEEFGYEDYEYEDPTESSESDSEIFYSTDSD